MISLVESETAVVVVVVVVSSVAVVKDVCFSVFVRSSVSVCFSVVFWVMYTSDFEISVTVEV